MIKLIARFLSLQIIIPALQYLLTKLNIISAISNFAIQTRDSRCRRSALEFLSESNRRIFKFTLRHRKFQDIKSQCKPDRCITDTCS